MLKFCAAIVFAAFASPAFAQSPLIAENVFVAAPVEVSANSFGVVDVPGRSVHGLAAIGEGADGKPQIQLLGCRFDVELQAENEAVRRVASVLSRKLTSVASADPPSAGHGFLSNPRPIGITDPVTSIGCNPKFRYLIFLFRQESAGRKAAIEALVFEHAAGTESAFEEDEFFSVSEKPSIQAREVVRAAHGFFRATFKSEESITAADHQQRELLRGLMMVAPTFPGLPFR